MSITDYERSIRAAQNALADIPKGAEAAAARAFNRALMAGRTAAVKEITKRYTVKAKDVRPTFKMKKASKTHLEAELISEGSALPLRAFAHKPATDTTGRKRKPIRVTIKGSNQFELTTSFVWKKHIFTRLGDTRLPVKKATGPSVPSMLGNENIVEEVQGVMDETAAKRMEHEMERLAGGK